LTVSWRGPEGFAAKLWGMVTPDEFDPHPDRTRWLRRSITGAVATAVLGITGTGLAVAIVTSRQPATTGDTQASSDNGSTGSSTPSSGSTSSNSGSSSGSQSDQGSGLGSSTQDAPTQGGSNGS